MRCIVQDNRLLVAPQVSVLCAAIVDCGKWARRMDWFLGGCLHNCEDVEGNLMLKSHCVCVFFLFEIIWGGGRAAIILLFLA